MAVNITRVARRMLIFIPFILAAALYLSDAGGMRTSINGLAFEFIERLPQWKTDAVHLALLARDRVNEFAARLPQLKTDTIYLALLVRKYVDEFNIGARMSQFASRYMAAILRAWSNLMAEIRQLESNIVSSYANQIRAE